MTTEQKNEQIALFLGFEKGKFDTFIAPKWHTDSVYNRYYKDELLFDSDYNWQLLAVDWIEENYKDLFRFWVSKHDGLYKVIVVIIDRDVMFTHKSNSRKEAIFESLFWLSQNYKNYI